MSEIQYNDALTDMAQKREILREGTFLLEVVDAEARTPEGTWKTTKEGLMKMTFELQPVDSQGKKSGYSVYRDVYLPATNPDNGKSPSKKQFDSYLETCYRLARTFDKNFPRYARKKPGAPGVYILPNGDEIDQGKKDALKREIDSQVQMAAVKWGNNPSALVGQAFYASVVRETYVDRFGQQKTRNNVVSWSISSEAPTEGEVITSDFTELA